MNHSGLDRAVGLIPAPQRHSRACLREAGVFHRRGLPTHDRSGEQGDGEVDKDEPRPRCHVDEIGYQGVVWQRGGELPVMHVASTKTVLGGNRGDSLPATHESVHVLVAHYTVDGVFRHDREPRPRQPCCHLPPTIQHLGTRPTPPVTSPKGAQDRGQGIIVDSPPRRGATCLGQIRPWDDSHALLTQEVACHLVPPARHSAAIGAYRASPFRYLSRPLPSSRTLM